MLEKIGKKFEKSEKSWRDKLNIICDQKLFVAKSYVNQVCWVGGWMEGLKIILRIAYSN